MDGFVNFRYFFKPFSIIYAGSGKFIVRVGKVNEFLTRYREAGVYKNNSVLDMRLIPQESFRMFGDKIERTRLNYYGEEEQFIVEINEDSTIYLKVPKIPSGAGGPRYTPEDSAFYIRDGYSGSLAKFYVDLEPSITTEVDSFDLVYVRRNDVFENARGAAFVGNVEDPFKFPIAFGELEDAGYLYVKLAEIKIGDSVQINQMWISDVFNPNRYFSPVLAHYRGQRVIVVISFAYKRSDQDGEGENVEMVYRTIQMDYNKPEIFLKTREEILEEVEADIKGKIEDYANNWASSWVAEGIVNYQLDVEKSKIQEIVSFEITHANKKIIARQVVFSPNPDSFQSFIMDINENGNPTIFGQNVGENFELIFEGGEE